MEFYEFEKYMNNIRNSLEMQDKYNEIMTQDFLDNMSGYLIDDVIELLETKFNTNLISWFVFETEFDKKNNIIKIYSNPCVMFSMYINTIEDLWIAITRV